MSESRGSTPLEPSRDAPVPHRIHAFAPYVATATAAVVYSLLALRRVWNLEAGAFDAGLLDNVIYKVSTGLGNVSGLTGESHYAGRPLVFVLGLPLYWLSSDFGYAGLLVAQAVSVAMVGFAAWLIADAIGLSNGRKYAALFFVLASPAAYWATIAELHTTGLSMGFVALTVAGAYRRWPLRFFWLLPFFASMARMEVGVAVVVVGLLLWSVSRSHARVTVAVGAAATLALLAIAAALPSSGGTVDVHLGYLGIDSLTQLPLAVVERPLVAMDELLNPVFLLSIVMWLVTVGIVLPMRAARWFLVALPTLFVAAVGSPRFADFWLTHYWNYLLVGAAIAFALSLAKWTFSDRTAMALVVFVVSVAWLVPGTIVILGPYPVVYPSASAEDRTVASLVSSEPGALSTMWELVLPGAHREWVYQFPTPFACRAGIRGPFQLVGPAPDVVITDQGWEELVSSAEVDDVRRTLSEDYIVVDRIGTYTVRALVPGAAPSLVAECTAASRD